MENNKKAIVVFVTVITMLAGEPIIDRVASSSKGYNHITLDISDENGKVSLASNDFSVVILETGQYEYTKKRFIAIAKKVSDFYYYYDLKSGDLIYTTNPDCDANSTDVANISGIGMELDANVLASSSIDYDSLMNINDSFRRGTK